MIRKSTGKGGKQNVQSIFLQLQSDLCVHANEQAVGLSSYSHIIGDFDDTRRRTVSKLLFYAAFIFCIRPAENKIR